MIALLALMLGHNADELGMLVIVNQHSFDMKITEGWWTCQPLAEQINIRHQVPEYILRVWSYDEIHRIAKENE